MIRTSDGTVVSKKAKDKKPKKWLIPAIIAAIVVVAAGGTALFFSLRGGQSREHEILSQAVKATYEGDAQSIWDLWPAAFQDRAIEEIGSLFAFDTAEETLEKLDDSLVNYYDTINTLYGISWTYTPTVTGEYTYTDEDLEDLNAQYYLMGIPDFMITDAKLYTVEVKLAGVNGVTGSQILYLPLIKQGGIWYLGQQIGTAYLNQYDEMELNPYGGLLDGFSIKVLDTPAPWETEGETVTEETVVDTPVTESIEEAHSVVSGNSVSYNSVSGN